MAKGWSLNGPRKVYHSIIRISIVKRNDSSDHVVFFERSDLRDRMSFDRRNTGVAFLPDGGVVAQDQVAIRLNTEMMCKTLNHFDTAVRFPDRPSGLCSYGIALP